MGSPPVFPGINETSFNPKCAVSWLEQQPEKKPLWHDIFQGLLQSASKPKQSSGNACAKLYGFVEMCSKSNQPMLRDLAFSRDTAIRLFDFFLEWNEQDSHRSMRLVLDFLIYSISNNPAPEIGISIKESVLKSTVSIITQQSSRPSGKSAMVALDHIIQKKLVYLSNILEIYKEIHLLPPAENVTWDAFVAKIFAWMVLPHVCPAAGRLLVTILTSPWYENKNNRHDPDAWHRFIYKGLQMNLEYLEPIKIYIFITLFKADRNGSLTYLHNLSSLQGLTGHGSNGWDLNSMLWLAMLEAGKKIGVVDEPGLGSKSKPGGAVQLQADILEIVLCHDSHEARSSAVSILIASPSTTKPYSAEILELLKQHLPSFHEDSDPKFRYDVLGHSRNMIRRIQGALDSLWRDHERVSRKAEKTELANNAAKLSLGGVGTGQPEKEIPQKIGAAQLFTTIRQHEDFVFWYVNFLKNELAPTTSYQRHITALKAMGFLLKSSLLQENKTASDSKSGCKLVDVTWLRCVLDLIMDPFDDVRETAASLITELSPKNATSSAQKQTTSLPNTTIDELRNFCCRADDLAKTTARADHSDGVARSFELLCRWNTDSSDKIRIPFTVLSSLETKISEAERDLATAVLQEPVHGSFASLRYIWSSLSNSKYSETDLKALDELQDRVIGCCQRIWQAVRHVLCDDSPEGHLPEELEEVDGLDTKDLLSYSFRAIHESSILMRTIINNARYDQKYGFLTPSRHNFETIGKLTFDELSNLRHRGAFTTVSQTFTSCCQLVKYYPAQSNEDPSLLDEWYKGTLACINTQVSTTRRSAGIPALIVGILSSNAEQPSFKDLIHKLQDIGRQPAHVSETDGSNLPQVHALNCIKDIFKCSYLSGRAEGYLTDCLQLAIDSLKSEVWAIRNCGLLLLRSLIDCLFGTNESKISIEAGWDGRTIKIPYHKFRALPMLLINLLEMGQRSAGVLLGTQTAESVFPALDIIRRAGPPEEYRDKLYDTIAWYLGSRIWHVREIAARTLCSFLLKPNWVESIRGLLASSGNSANKLHGSLLTLRFLLERLVEVMPDQLSDRELYALYDLLKALPTAHECLNTCSEARAVFVEIVNFLARLNAREISLQTTIAAETPFLLLAWASTLSNQHDQVMSPSALLNSRLGEAAVQQALRQPNEEGENLTDILTAALKYDINVACYMLETVSKSNASQSNEVSPDLINTYIEVCFRTDTPEPRTVALENLADLIDVALSSASETGLKHHLPPEEVISKLWTDLQRKPMNPSLSDAIIRVSGPLLATVLRRRSEPPLGHDLVQWLRSWGALMSDAGMADRTFDTRMAAANSMKSLSTATSTPLTTAEPPDPAHLSWLLALYDALNDDDDEIRAAAASATTPIFAQSLVSIEAGKRLLQWLGARYGATDELKKHVASRLIGQTCPSPNIIWTSAEAQLTSAMRLDASLFVVEEQNLYVDEVREAQRWRDVFASLDYNTTVTTSSTTSTPAAAATATALTQWTLAGLHALLATAADTTDGPLGWTTKPAVFALCARVLAAGAALAARGDSEVAGALRAFAEVGRRTGVHGLLLGMCEFEETDR
ncbi:putative death-receptor fusion protein-domain-containing protein [Xylariaceae sp. FL0662B]|nr:putative death-receptor fusion protein-domain-containing protein [Xylariaceae sp. FL0662B]